MTAYKNMAPRIQELTKSFFPDIMQERIIVYLNDTIKETGIDAFTIGFENPSVSIVQLPTFTQDATTVLEEIQKTILTGKVQEKSVDTPATPRVQTPIESMRVSVQVQAGFENILYFISTIQSHHYNIVISDINIASGRTEGEVTGNITLRFYAVPKIDEQDLDFLRWDFYNVYGRFNPFGELAYRPEADDRRSAVARDEIDFVMTAKPITSDLPSVMIGKAGDTTRATYVHGDNAGFENVEFYVFMRDNRYFFKYKTQTELFPFNYYAGVEFSPRGDNILILAFCNPRTGVQDQNGINLTISNLTDLELVLQISNEDKVRPRINIVIIDGNVVVRR
ncbi:MAG: hypothetical protein ACLKAO_01660 [Alkaliphilus sp.]